MKEAVDHGLDMAIVNYAKIYPLYKIPEVEVDLARKLIFREPLTGDPLQVYMAHFAGLNKVATGREPRRRAAVGRGQAEAAASSMANMASARASASSRWNRSSKTRSRSYSPLDLINTVLLDGMKTVGELFGARKMQLPSVLDSAAR